MISFAIVRSMFLPIPSLSRSFSFGLVHSFFSGRLVRSTELVSLSEVAGVLIELMLVRKKKWLEGSAGRRGIARSGCLWKNGAWRQATLATETGENEE